MTIAPEEDRLNAQIAFAIEIDKLKRIIRRNHLIDGSRRENTAEHSWYVGTLAMVLGEHAPPGTDLQRVVAMLLVHDLVEIDAGDTFIYDAAACCRASRGRSCGNCGTSSRPGRRRRRDSPRH